MAAHAPSDSSETHPNAKQPRRSAVWLIRNAGTMAAVQISGAALTFGLHILVARRFGTESYGIFAHAIALSGLLAMLAPAGWNNAIVRFLSQYRNQESWSLLAGVLKTCRRTVASLSLLLSLLLVLAGLFANETPELQTSIFVSAALIPLMAAIETWRRALQGLNRFAMSLIPEQLILPALSIAGVLAIPRAFGIRFLLPWYVLSALIAFVGAEIQLRAAVPTQARRSEPSFKNREWHLSALPMLGSSIGYLVLNRLDVALLGTMVSMADVGSYSAARRVVMIGSFALASLNSVAAPGLAASYFRQEYGEFRRLITRIRLLSCVVGLPFFAALLVAPDFFLALFKLQDPAARLVLRILAVGQIVNVATGPVGTAMAMSSHERAQAVICGIAAGLAVATMPFAVNRYGLVGAATVTASTIALQNILMTVAVERLYRKHAAGAAA